MYSSIHIGAARRAGGRLRGLLLAAAAAALASGCAVTDLRSQATQEVAALAKGPAAPPFRTITGFTDALRCMDSLMIGYGVRDLPILVEDLVDQTKKVNAGTRDMLISAISDLSKRSRAVRLVTFGVDSSNLANFLANAESKRPYEAIPLFDIRGSVSQLDEGLFKKQIEGGVTFGPVGVGAAKSADASVLAIDLSVISARDYALVPGVTARNSVLIYKEGSGVDGEAEYKKLGLNFGMTLTRSEGRTQALRGLVELAVIELMGKLTRTPYWSCLGADPSSAAVSTEIGDWYYSMTVHGELLPWMQQQLALRGAYDGPIDGQPSAEFDAALARYRPRLGLSAEPKLDEALFAAYLRTPHEQVVFSAIRPAEAAGTKPAELGANGAAPAPERARADRAGADRVPAERAATDRPPVEQAPTGQRDDGEAAEPIAVAIGANRPRFRRGEPVALSIAPSRDAHVYCYLQDIEGKVQRFFPNRFVPDARVEAARPLALPGRMGFELTASERGGRETVACFVTARDVASRLPPTVLGTDFETLPVASLRDVRQAFVDATGGRVGSGELHVDAK